MKIQLSEHFTFKKLLHFVYPSVIMMIFTSIYVVVDGLFVSNYVGKTAFAAINLISPFIMAMSALGFMMGTGGSAIVAKTLGEGKKEKAGEYFSMLVYVTLIGGIALSLVGIALTPSVATARCQRRSPEKLYDLRSSRLYHTGPVHAAKRLPELLCGGRKAKAWSCGDRHCRRD